MARFYKLLLAVALCAGLFALVPQRADALSSIFTDASNNPTAGANMYPMVSWADGSNITLDARQADIKVFTTATSGTMTITIVDACRTTGLNDQLNTNISVTVKPGTSSAQTKNNTSGCNGNNITFSVPASDFGSSPAYGQWRYVTVRVTKTGGVGIKAYRVQGSNLNADGTKITFDDGEATYWKETTRPNTDALSVWNADPTAGSHDEASADFEFTPRECIYDDSQDVYLKWFDADWGAANETGGISWTLRDVTDGRDVVTRSNAQLGGNGSYNFTNVGKLNYNHLYRWRWSGVDKINGIQVWLPFSEISNVMDCGGSVNPTPPPPQPQPQPPANCTTFTHNMGSHSVYRFTAYYDTADHVTSTPVENSIRSTMGAWKTFSPTIVYSSGNRSNSTDNPVPFTFAYPNPGGAPVRRVYIERWNHVDANGNGTLDWQYTSGISDVTCPVGAITPSSSVGPSAASDPASTVDDWIEQGGAVVFRHFLRNDGNTPYGSFLRNPNFNYSIFNVAGGTAGGRAGIVRAGPVILPGTVFEVPDNEGALLRMPNNGPLGQAYCQDYTVNPRSSFDNLPLTSVGACTHVVGGKTSVAIGLGTQPYIEPNESTNLSASLLTNFFTPWTGWPGYIVNCTYTVTREPAGGAPVPVAGGACTNSFVGANGTTTAVNYAVPPGSPPGTQFCMTVNLNGAAGPNGINNFNLLAAGAPSSQQICTTVIAKPYFKAYGTDISVGNGFDGEACVNPDASVVGWNKGSGANYAGTGAQFAILAQKEIRYAASGQYLPTQPQYGNAPWELSFANANRNPIDNVGLYGGDFGSGNCISDYYGTKPDGTLDPWVSIDASNAAGPTDDDRIFEHTGNLTLAGGALQLGNSTKLYVDGDVFITGDITGNEGATSIRQIPNFTLFVRGDIIVSGNVKKLYGTYIAQPRAPGSGGNIYTCGVLNNGYTLADLDAAPSRYDECHNQLVISGAFVAEEVHMSRTWGSLYQDTDRTLPGGSGYANAAEVFQYNPLNWLRGSTTADTHPDTVLPYDAITTLPPVL
jgi:hypothetical protein